MITAYPTARSVKAAERRRRTAGRRRPSSKPQRRAWGETDIKAILDQKPIEANKDKDLMGPVPLGAALNVPAPAPPAPPAGKAPAADAPKPETRIVVIGDSDFASNNFLGIQGNRDMFLNIVNWLVAAGEPDLHPPEGSRRSPADHERRRAAEHHVAVVARYSGDRVRARHRQLGEEARMRSGKALLALTVVFGALLAYLYFVDSKKPVGDAAEKHDKVFTVDASKVEELTVKGTAGETTSLKKEKAGWQLVQPVTATADESMVSGITSTLSTLENNGAVDEAPKDLAPYGLSQPRISVTFKSQGDKAAAHAAPRQQDPDRRRYVRAARR